jgi:zinc protease
MVNSRAKESRHWILVGLVIVLMLSYVGCENGGTGRLLSKTEAIEQYSDIDIPYEKFVLDNGLTLIVHEDHKAPIAAVNVWYHVGSKNERVGKTGFAHLFEHLMFNGSEHYDDDYFKPLEKIGATDLNGTTNNDRTNYFQTVPTSALDVALWMESDRMGHLLGAITQEKLDEQRGVVQNEKRQGENRPYGKVWEMTAANTYPAGHPYSWTVIGSMEDLDAASLDDVHEWFKTHYGASNAVLSIAGDIDTAEVKKKVEEYFGDIPSGPPVAHHQSWIAKMEGVHRQQLEDRVPQAMLMMVFNTPEWRSADADYLDLAAGVLGGGKTSRLYKRLVYKDQTATQASAYTYAREIGGQFGIRVMAKPGQDLGPIEEAVNEELERFLKEGLTEKELKLIKTRTEAGFIRGVERIGGFGGKSDILATNEIYGGSPDFYKVSLKRMREATVEQVHEAAKTWLDDGVYILEVHPFGEYATKPSEVDRSGVPEPGEVPEARLTEFKRTKLSNGLEVIVAERHSVPVITFNMVIKAGFSTDMPSSAGTASLTLDMMDEGTAGRSALEISEDVSMLGASIGLGCGLDTSTAYLSSLKSNLDESLELYADVILNPSFPEEDFERLRKRRLASIKQEKSTPTSMGRRVIGKLLYGENHAYSIPFTGTGSEEAVENATTADLRRFHQTWIRPNNATLIVVGDTTVGEIVPKLEKLFADWSSAEVPAREIAKVNSPGQTTIYLMNRPEAEQSVLYACQLVEGKSCKDDIAMEMFTEILGGSFTSRINMNLREDKHWTYGARSGIRDTQSMRPLVTSTQIQTDKTAEAMQEILKEYKEIIGDRGPSAEELEKVQKNETLGLAGRWETMGAVNNSIEEIVVYGLGDDYYDGYVEKIRSLTVKKIAQTGNDMLSPDALLWAVVGDVEKIEPAIRELGWGEVHVIDVEGNVIR